MSNPNHNYQPEHRQRARRARAAIAERRSAAVAQQLASLADERAEQTAWQREQLALEAEQRQAEVRQLLEMYAEERAERASEQQAELALTAEQRQIQVQRQLADFAYERAERALTLQERQAEVQRQLEGYAAERTERATRLREQIDGQLVALRRRVADDLAALGRRRASRSDQPLAEIPAPLPPAAPSAPQAEPGQRLGQVGLVAYAQMARVVVLRELERGAPGDEVQQRQIDACLDGLASNLRPFLDELHAAQATQSAEQRAQQLEIVEGVRRTVAALSSELDAAPWPTSPAQRQAFHGLVERLRRRLAPLQAQLDAAAQALRPAEARQRPGRRARPQAPTEQPRGRSYRDNLTSIHGIGPALQQRLNRAGICTYIQLALSSPDELRRALGETGRMANVEDWIVQARALAGMP